MSEIELVPDDPVFISSGSMPGVWCTEDMETDDLLYRADFSYKHRVPLYFANWDFRSGRKLHDDIIFLRNVGYVFVFGRTINNRPFPLDLFALSIRDKVEMRNMSEHGEVSTRFRKLFHSNREKFEGYDWGINEGYEFPSVYDVADFTIREIK